MVYWYIFLFFQVVVSIVSAIGLYKLATVKKNLRLALGIGIGLYLSIIHITINSKHWFGVN